MFKIFVYSIFFILFLTVLLFSLSFLLKSFLFLSSQLRKIIPFHSTEKIETVSVDSDLKVEDFLDLDEVVFYEKK